jgi:hypothetical protein
MSKDIEILTKQIIKHYGIDVPVMATRVVGNTLELYLYGGRVLRVAIEGEEEKEREPRSSRREEKGREDHRPV